MKQIFRLNSCQHSPEGRVISSIFSILNGCRFIKMWTSDVIHKNADWEYNGCPANGGSNDLSLYMSKPDIIAFFELIEEFEVPRRDGKGMVRYFFQEYFGDGLAILKTKAGL